MNCPKLTIALQTYNRGRSGYLRESLEAILAQTYTDFELLVLDNHSTDETPDLVLGYKDPRLTYIRQPPGGTSATNYNRGLWMSRGIYVLPTHDDDVMEPTMIERQMAFIDRHPDLLCLATNVSLINEHGLLIQPRLYEMERDLIFRQGEYIPTYLEEKFWLPTPTYIFRRDTKMAVFREAVRARNLTYFPSGDIWALFLLNLRGPIGILADPLYRYRQHPGQESRNVNQSAPLVHIIKLLLKCQRRRLHPQLPYIHAAHARFQAQDVLFRNGSACVNAQLVRKIQSLRTRWEKVVSPQDRALDVILPFEILLREIGLGATVPAEGLDLLHRSPAKAEARRGYRQWVHVANDGHTLFEGRPEFRRIAILGSMFTAFLLVQEARRAGIEVACCLDSSPARIGQRVLGVPIVPHEEMRGMPPVDAVILSSERDHEAALKKILAANLPDPDLPVLSWKELAQEASKFQNTNGTAVSHAESHGSALSEAYPEPDDSQDLRL